MHYSAALLRSPLKRGATMLKQFKKLSYRHYLGAALLALILFAVLGFFALPALVKAVVLPRLSEKIHRPISLEKLTFNPFTLQLWVHDLRIGGLPETPELLRVDEVYVNASVMSLIKLAPVLDEIRLTGPVLQLVREAPTRFNVSDLIDTWRAQPPNPKPQHFSLNNIRLLKGSISVNDQVLKQQHEIKDLTLQLPFLSNLPHVTDIYVQPELHAVIDGAVLQAQAQSKPFKNSRESDIQLKLQGVNLLSYAALLPLPEQTTLEQGYFSTDLKIKFKTADKATPEISVAGQVQLEKLALKSNQTQLRFERLQTTIVEAQPLAGRYDLAAVELDALSLLNAALTQKGPLLQWASVQVQGVRADTVQRNLDIEAVKVDRAQLAVLRNAQGQWNWKTWLASLPGTPHGNKPEAGLSSASYSKPASAPSTPSTDSQNLADHSTQQTEASAKAWRGTVKSVVLSQSSATFHDAAVRPEVSSGVTDVNLTLRDVALDPTQPFNVVASLRVLPSGTLNVAGEVTRQPLGLAVNVQVERLPLVLGQPYWQDRLKLSVLDGQLSARGELKWQAPTAPELTQNSTDNATPNAAPLVTQMATQATTPITSPLSYRGNLSVTRFRALEDASGEEFLRWNQLGLNNIDLQGQQVSVGAIALQNFFAKAVLDKNGQLNLAQLLVQPKAQPALPSTADETETSPSATPPASAALALSPPLSPTLVSAPAPAPASAPSATRFAVHLGGVRLQNGNVNFSDYFVRPNYQVNLTQVNGSLSAMSSVPSAVPAQVQVQAQVDGDAPVTISGALNLLAPTVLLDIKADAKGIDLPTLTPYSGKYAGYAIEKGKLSVDVHYQVKEGALQASNHLFLDQLTFGEKIDSPSATKLPVQLAIALLKNSRGEIDINLPISGSLNDPQFSVGGLIVRVLVNLLVKAVTSPFNLLAGLFGGADADWSQVSFMPGTATLTPDALNTLQGLAKALNDRPGLKLEITGHVNSVLEQNALQKNQLQQALLNEKRKSSKSQNPGTQNAAELNEDQANDEVLTEAERARLLERVYANTDLPNKPRGVTALIKKTSAEDMEAQLLTHFNPNDEALRQLAIQRAQTARYYLTREGKVSAERIFLLAPRVSTAAPEEDKTKTRCNAQCAAFSLR